MSSKIRRFIQDKVDLMLNRQIDPVPPEVMISAIGGHYQRVGEEFFQIFTRVGGLKKTEKVLDIGCGCGRMAIPLTKYLSNEGRYEGFDVVADQINWCIDNITPRKPNFRFRMADVYNKQYNPNGKYKASEHKFPYADQSFDFVFATSVFTHMLPDDMENYLSETARVLKRHGRCFLTLYLLNEESQRLIEATLSPEEFKYDLGVCRTTDKETPESCVAYDESFIRSLCSKYQLNIVEPLHYGGWRKRQQFLTYQDAIIAVKY